MMALVSVVIPCYRCSATISRAISSVMNQSLLPKEIVLVDDFSNDNNQTLKAINDIQLISTDIEIKTVYLDVNGGPGTARNEGWLQSTQPYIAFLDADDSWHPRKIEIQYQWMIEYPDVILTGHPSTSFTESTLLQGEICGKQINKYSLLLKNCFPTRSIMVKRDIALRFFPGKRYAEDYLLWLSIVISGGRSYMLNMPMAYSYKAEFGEGGLTGDLLDTQYGVIDTYRQLYRSELISRSIFVSVSAFSWIKYIRRLLITKFKSFCAR